MTSYQKLKARTLELEKENHKLKLIMLNLQCLLPFTSIRYEYLRKKVESFVGNEWDRPEGLKPRERK